jgi:hypothetical protein
MYNSNYTLRSIQNYLLATTQLLKFLSAPIAHGKAKEIIVSKKKMELAVAWVATQSKGVGVKASQQTRARNSREHLEATNRWLSFSDFLSGREKVKNDFIKAELPSSTLRDLMMVLLYSFSVPLRTQNLHIVLTDHIPSQSELKNNYFIWKGREESYFIFINFKNNKYMGVQHVPISTQLFDLLTIYLRSILPKLITTKETDCDDMEDIDDIESDKDDNDNVDDVTTDEDDEDDGDSTGDGIKDIKKFVGFYLFPSKDGKRLKNAGEKFAGVWRKYSGKYITPSTLRKIVETEADRANIFSATERSIFSNSLLHDYATAKEYYVLEATMEKHRKGHELFEKLCANANTTSNTNNQRTSTPSVITILPTPLPNQPSSSSQPLSYPYVTQHGTKEVIINYNNERLVFDIELCTTWHEVMINIGISCYSTMSYKVVSTTGKRILPSSLINDKEVTIYAPDLLPV